MIRLATTPIPSIESVAYQVPTGFTSNMTQIMLCNTHTGTVTVNIALTGSAATSSASTDRLFSAFSLVSNETVMVSTNIPLDAGDKIWTSASVNNVVNFVISGTETEQSEIVGLATDSDLVLLVNDMVPSSEESIYSVPSDYVANITQIMLCNTDASSAVTVNIAITDSLATSTSSADRILSDFSIEASSTVMLMVHLPLAEEEQLWADASINDVLHLVMSGITTGTI
jgi:hypothetical protein